MHEISKVDAIVAAAHQLAKTLQQEASNIGETESQQLKWLVQMLQHTTTSSMQKWADQTSTDIILPNHKKPRLEEQPHSPPITQVNSPHGPGSWETPSPNWKIVTSPKEPKPLLLPYITQDNDHMTLAHN